MDTEQRTAIEMPDIERLEPVHTVGLKRVVAVLRVLTGWTFLWAFLDKAFAIGFHTGRLEDGTIDFFAKNAAWFNGGSPTKGVFAYALHAGPFQGFYENLGNVQMTAQGPTAAPPEWINVVYMASLLLIGLGLITGVMTRLAAAGGIIWMAIFYTATAIWPENNPFVDEHVVYIVVLVGLILANAGRYYGLGKIWQRYGFVKNRAYLY
jgi:thiosulfate dehydrogenase (quinone) large subunit